MARRPTLVPPPSPPNAAFDAQSAWFDAAQAGSEAWLSAWTQMTGAWLAAVQGQTQAAGQLMALFAQGLPVAPGLPSVEHLLREEQLLAEAIAERTDDAVRQTLKDLGAAPGEPRGGAPLPE